ncbi:hypothetical protein AVEN_144797-1 [Araneus ventricosus]|uniref:Uncharacterized protein n=1 Tax=Araneus ventricosus TaxID=182803 RepID=A0A4Y2JF20_ARAVE|nr:hypothetical protein AVEN_144797-1 [Araneus ventricosus]
MRMDGQTSRFPLSCVPAACLSASFVRGLGYSLPSERNESMFTRGLVKASVVSRVVVVNRSHIKEARRHHCIRSLELCLDICKATRRRNDTSVRIPPTTVHKCEPRATRSLAKVGTRL